MNATNHDGPFASYAGTCVVCRTSYAAGDPIAFKREGARWRPIHAACAAPRPSAVAVAGAPILELLRGARSSGLRWPKLTLDLDGRRVQLSLAGDASKHPGTVNVTDGRRYPENTWFGRVLADGTFQPGRDCDETVVAILRRLAEDPAGTAADHGHRSGSCCFCGRELNDPRSTAVGYGPICAEKWLLPWGEDVIEDPAHAFDQTGTNGPLF